MIFYTSKNKCFFENKGININVVKIEGSVELAPLLNLSDAIVDIVETGSTLKENGLEVIEDIAQISARMIVNTVSMKFRKDEVEDFVNNVKGEI